MAGGPSRPLTSSGGSKPLPLGSHDGALRCAPTEPTTEKMLAMVLWETESEARASEARVGRPWFPRVAPFLSGQPARGGLSRQRLRVTSPRQVATHPPDRSSPQIRQYDKKWPAPGSWLVAYFRRGRWTKSDRTAIWCRGPLSLCDSHSRTVALTSFEREARRHIPGSGETELPEAGIIREEIPSALLRLCLQPA
jgi:hypothetical protein